MMWVSATDLEECRLWGKQYEHHDATFRELFIWQLRLLLVGSSARLTRLELIRKWLEARGIIFSDRQTEVYSAKIDIGEIFIHTMFKAQKIADKGLGIKVEAERIPGTTERNRFHLEDSGLLLNALGQFQQQVNFFLQALTEQNKDGWLSVPCYSIDKASFSQATTEQAKIKKKMLGVMDSSWSMGRLVAFTLAICDRYKDVQISTEKAFNKDTCQWITTKEAETFIGKVNIGKANLAEGINWQFIRLPFGGSNEFLGISPKQTGDEDLPIPSFVSRTTILEIRAEMEILRKMEEAARVRELGATDSTTNTNTNKRRKIDSVPVPTPVPTGLEGKQEEQEEQEEQEANITNEQHKSPSSSPPTFFQLLPEAGLPGIDAELQKWLAEIEDDEDDEELKKFLEEMGQGGPASPK